MYYQRELSLRKCVLLILLLWVSAITVAVLLTTITTYLNHVIFRLAVELLKQHLLGETHRFPVIMETVQGQFSFLEVKETFWKCFTNE